MSAVVADRGGTIAYANPAVTGLLGWEPEALVGQPVSMLVPRRLLAAHRAGFGRWSRTGTSRLAGQYLRVSALQADGQELPVGIVLSAIGPPEAPDHVVALLRPRDAPTEAINAVALDLVQVLAADLGQLDSVDRLLAIIGERLDWDVTALWVVDDERNALVPAGTWVAAGDDHAAFREASEATTFSPGVGLPGRVWATSIPAAIDDLAEDDNLPRREAARSCGLRTAFAFPVEHHGRIQGVIEMFRARAEPIDPGLPAVLAGIGGHLGPFLDRLRTRERRARAERRLRLVNAATELLARNLDYPTSLEELCSLLVPGLAEAAVIDLVEGPRLRRVGSAYADPDYRAAVDELSALVPLETVNAGPIAVIHTGEPLVYEEIGEEELRSGLPPEVPDAVLTRLAPTSSVTVPLTGRGRAVGTLSLSRRGGRFDDEDVRFVEELGRHVGLAVANAQLFEREHAIAAALQQSLLPPALPPVPGVEIAARYEPGGSGLAVGGDFYDVFAAAEGSWYAVVGDVCGTGAEAAAITSQARYTARALAPHVAGPAALLDEVNRALLERGDTRFCTALVCHVAPGDATTTVTLASGGHPPAVLLAGGDARLVDCPGTLLGVYAEVSHGEVTLELGAGDTLALYTDGVIEARDPHGRLLGEEGLTEVLAGCVGASAEETATQLVRSAVEHASLGPADDIAVLVLRQA